MPPSKSAKPAPKRRNAVATKESILDAAKAVFTEKGYSAAGVREIAARAGINQALVNRYYSSKEGLFREAILPSFDISSFLDDDLGAVSSAMARHVAYKTPRENDFDPTLVMVRSAGSSEAAPLIARGLEELFVAPLAERLAGEHAHLRATLAVAVLAGTALMREVLKLRAFQGSAEETEALISAVLDIVFNSGAKPEASGEYQPSA